MGFTVSGIPEVQTMLIQQGERAEKIAPEMLEAGAKTLIAAQKKEVQKIRVRTGTLAASIGMGEIRRTRDGTGYKTSVFPQGYQAHGFPRKGKRGKVSNAQVGFMHEYGTSKMPGIRWMSAANVKAESAVQDSMRKVWEARQYG